MITLELCVMVAAVAVSELNGVVPPTAPVIVTLPAVPPNKVSVREPLPLIVLEKEIAAPAGEPPPLVVSTERLAAIATGPVMEIAPPAEVALPLKEMAVVPV